MTEDVFEYSAAKMRKHGMTDMAIAQFRRLYEVWRNEEASSWIREDEVEPLVSVPSFHDVYETINHDKAVDAFAKTAFLKLNGGLGTAAGTSPQGTADAFHRHHHRTGVDRADQTWRRSAIDSDELLPYLQRHHEGAADQ